MGIQEVADKVADVKWASYDAWLRIATKAHEVRDYSYPAWLTMEDTQVVYRKIDEAFTYWTSVLPEPSTYDNLMATVSQLKIDITGTKVNKDVANAKDIALPWKGGGEKFRENYLAAFETINDHQGDMLTALYNSYKSAKEVVDKSKDDAVKLCDSAWQAFKSLGEGGGDWQSGAKILLDIANLAAGIGAAALAAPATAGISLTLAVAAGSAGSCPTGFLTRRRRNWR